VPGLNQMDEAADGLRPRTEVHKPFLIPHGVQGHGSHGRERSRDIRATERAEAVFRTRTVIRIAGIQRRPAKGNAAEGLCVNTREHQESREVRLIEHIHVGKGREISAITPVAEVWINLVSQTGIFAVLDIQPLSEAGWRARPIVDVRQIGDLLLADGLRAEEGGLKEELGYVRPRKSRFGVTWPRLRGPT